MTAKGMEKMSLPRVVGKLTRTHPLPARMTRKDCKLLIRIAYSRVLGTTTLARAVIRTIGSLLGVRPRCRSGAS